MTARTGDDFVSWPSATDDRTLGIVDLLLALVHAFISVGSDYAHLRTVPRSDRNRHVVFDELDHPWIAGRRNAEGDRPQAVLAAVGERVDVTVEQLRVPSLDLVAG